MIQIGPAEELRLAQRQTRVLVVDDDPSILEITSRSLRAEGLEVDTTPDGERVLETIRSRLPDVVVLDVMLPGRDGFELCREIRRFSTVPVILLTAKTDTVDVIVGLESGADDYVTKPFEMKELVARIRSILRRMRAQDDDSLLRVGPLEIRPREGTVTKRGEHLSLTKTEFQLLCVLAARPRRVFSREALLRDVWGYDYFGDARLVDVHVSRLRAKVEDDPARPGLIQTVRGMGYRLSETD